MRRRLFGLCWILVLAAFVGGCTQAPTRTPSPSPSRMVDYAAMETAIKDNISSGSLRLSTINAVLVSVGGETKVAHYRNRSKPQDALHVWSVTKSVVSALIGIAIDEKIISGLDATLLELLPRYQKYLTCGGEVDHAAPAHVHDGRLSTRRPRTFREHPQRLQKADRSDTDDPDRRPRSAAGRGLQLLEPGRTSGLRRAAGSAGSSRSDHPRSVLEYAREKLFDPLEIDSSGAREERVLLSDPAYDRLTRFDWATDAAGLNTACCLLRLRPADMIKFGELYLGGGVWHGKQILPAGWVEQTMTPGEVSPQYGLMWWLDIDLHGHPAWLAQGWAGQLIAVVPEHQLVVAIGSVPTAEMDLAGYNMWLWVNDVIMPALG